MILADENIDFRIIQSLRNTDLLVKSIFEDLRGISDIEVIRYSKNPPRIILTEDKDFGEWVYAHKEQNISVILLRYTFNDLPQIIDVLINLLKTKEDQLFGKFVTITKQKIRIRTI